MKVWKESRMRRNSGNRAGLTKQTQDRCGGKIRLTRKNRRKSKRHHETQKTRDRNVTLIFKVKTL